MKRAAVFLAAALLLALAAPAHAGQSYTNDEFKFACTYPEGWKMKEESASSEMGGAEAAVAKSMGFEMPRMASACFGQKKCKPGDMGPDPQIHVMMMQIPKVKKGEKPRESAKADKGEKGSRSDCEVIARGNMKWAGGKVPYTTTRCEEKKKWRYTTTLMKMRNLNGRKYNYMLDCTMRSKSKDKAESLIEFNRDLKPYCDANVASGKFLK